MHQQRTIAQNRALYALAAKIDVVLGPTADGIPAEGSPGKRWLRRRTAQISGQTRTSALTIDQASRLIELLERDLQALQQQAEAPALRGPRNQSSITPRQQAYIERLARAIARVRGRYSQISNPQRLRSWCQHYLHVPWPQTQRDADAAIEFLKSILARDLPPRDVLENELEALGRVAEILEPWPKRLVREQKHRDTWGPYQWSKVHEIAVHARQRGLI